MGPGDENIIGLYGGVIPIHLIETQRQQVAKLNLQVVEIFEQI